MRKMTTINQAVNEKIITGPLPNDPPMSNLQKQQFSIANKQISIKEYAAARKTLKGMNHVRADRWIQKLDMMYPNQIKAKRNLWPIIILLLIVSIVGVIIAYNTIKKQVQTTYVDSSMFQLELANTGGSQEDANLTTCSSVEVHSKDENVTSDCLTLRLNFKFCYMKADNWDIYDACLKTFNDGIENLRVKGRK
jgi:hypothetical protein